MVAAGSTTYRRRDLERGLEPDECFYIQNAQAVQGKQLLDPATDPPPDLVIEIDVTSSSLNRLDIYAALGVFEVWRCAGNTMGVHCLSPDGQLQPQERSKVFEGLVPCELLSFLQQYEHSTDTELARAYRASLRREP
jgi:Uma2 family endonuclease